MLSSQEDDLQRLYASLSIDQQEKYGVEYLKGMKEMARKCMMKSWDPIYVVNAMAHTVTATHPRDHYPLGLACAPVTLLSMLPYRLTSWIISLFMGKTPVLAAFKADKEEVKKEEGGNRRGSQQGKKEDGVVGEEQKVEVAKVSSLFEV